VPSSNPQDKKMMAYLIAAETLMGSDEFIPKMKQAIKFERTMRLSGVSR
jgi:hypothetical protein